MTTLNIQDSVKTLMDLRDQMDQWEQDSYSVSMNDRSPEGVARYIGHEEKGDAIRAAKRQLEVELSKAGILAEVRQAVAAARKAREESEDAVADAPAAQAEVATEAAGAMSTSLRARHYRNVLTWAYGADLISAVQSTVTHRLDAEHEKGTPLKEGLEKVQALMEERHSLSPGILLLTELAAEMPEDEWVASAHEAIMRMTPGRILDAARLYEMPDPTTDAARLIEWLEAGE